MKKPLLLFLFALLGFIAKAQGNLTITVPNTVICHDTGTTYLITYTDPVTTYLPTNSFTVELSDAQGSFANPLVVGSINDYAQWGQLFVSFPATLPPGTGYRMRVVASAPAVTGADNGTDLTLDRFPQTNVTPTTVVACNGTPVQLSASGADSYNWTPGIGLSSTTGTTVLASPGISTSYTVSGTNVCGTSSATVLVEAQPFNTVLKETMGTTNLPLSISAHESVNGFNNDLPFMSGTGIVDFVSPSYGYPAASGGAHILLPGSGAPNTFQISGLNTLGHGDLQLSFGVAKSTNAANGSALTVELFNGSTYIPLSVPPLPTGSGTIGWHHVTATIPAAYNSQNLSLVFTNTNSSATFRLDDILIRNASPLPVTTPAGPISVCTGTTVLLTAGAANSYSWSNGSTNQIISVTQSGNYTVTVTDANGCINTSAPVAVTIAGAAVPAVTANSPVCAGQTVQLSASASAATSFNWTGPNGFSSALLHPTIPNATVAHAGIYSLTSTVPGCGTVLNTTQVFVTPAGLVPVVTTNGPVCEGQNVVLSTPAVAGGTYAWTGPNGFSSSQQNPTVFGLSTQSSGVYAVTVTTGCGPQTASANVQPAAAPAAPVLTNTGPVCSGQSVTISASGAYPAGTTYYWSNSYSFLTANQSETYNVTGFYTNTYSVQTMVNGCLSPVGTNTVSAYPPIPNQLHPYAIQQFCPGTTMELTASGGLSGYYTWTGPNGFSATGNTIQVPNYQPVNYGTYTLTSGNASCLSTGTVTIGYPKGPAAFSNSPVCPGANIFLAVDSVWVPSSFSWTGPNGFTSNLENPLITNVTAANAGLYSVYEILSSCITDPTVIQVDVTSTPPIAASNNSPINQGGTLVLTAAAANGTYTWTGPNGYYQIGFNPYMQNVTPANAGDYTVSLDAPGCNQVTAVTNVVVNPLNQVTGLVYKDANNNGLQDPGESHFSGILIFIQPGNYLTSTDSMGMYSAYLPDGTYIVSVAGLAYYQTASPATYSITLTGGTQISAGNNFGIHTTVVADLEAEITEVLPAAPGFVTNHRLRFRNTGSTVMSGTLRYLPNPAFIQNGFISPGYTLVADTLVWTFSNLQPGSFEDRYVNMTVPATTTLGTMLTSTVKVSPATGDATPANNTFILSQTVTGSWDPNDKAVQPAGPITVQDIAAGQDLVYTIRFQNTGTAPAVNVLLVDTLSTNLDLTSLQMLSSSHNYVLSIRENGILEWRFNNIMLPDSNSNEPASHGDVQYRIKPKSSLIVGDNIFNTAHIFFDFNEAVVTNTTHTPVGITATPDMYEASKLQLYPNPSSGFVTVLLQDAKPGHVQVQLFNNLGMQVHSSGGYSFSGNYTQQINLAAMPTGMYFVKVQKNGRSYTKKLVRN